ncbi:MAG: NAD(P)-dependent oxidoreductase [Rhodospirillales bacterium]
MKIGFIGLGNVGAKLAGSVLRNGFDLTVHDLNRDAARAFLDKGADWADSPKDMAATVDVVITCLPSPAACAAVVEGPNGILEGIRPGLIWAEMSTTDESEIKRLAAKVAAAGGEPIECPVSGGCHRAATGNISIFAGCDRTTFERMLPLLTVLGRRVLHTGPIGSASVLKVMTNYLATANLVSLSEALATMAKAGIDLGVTYEAIRISSGNSFVHETESQVILNGSRNVDFTTDLVLKDIGLFQKIADDNRVKLELSPLLIEIFEDHARRYGPRELSTAVVKRIEEDSDVSVHADGFPAELIDDEPEEPGYEVVPRGRSH